MTIAACPPSSPITRGVVVFVPADFKTAFPEFATVANAALSINFGFATLQLRNSCGSRVQDATVRESLLNLLTAHITQLRNGINGQPAPGIVGRIDSATEGSVSVSAEMDSGPVYGKDYYVQTQYGALYWQSTARWRQMVYIPAPPVCADFPAGPFGGWPGNEPGCGC